MPNKNGDFTLEELIHPAAPLAQFYHKKLPIRRWAGKLSKAEKEYVRWVREQRQNATRRTG